MHNFNACQERVTAISLFLRGRPPLISRLGGRVPSAFGAHAIHNIAAFSFPPSPAEVKLLQRLSPEAVLLFLSRSADRPLASEWAFIYPSFCFVVLAVVFADTRARASRAYHVRPAEYSPSSRVHAPLAAAPPIRGRDGAATAPPRGAV